MSRQRTEDATVDLARILSGKSHAPVVYFVRMGENVKIGTSTNLKARMNSFYASVEDVLAVVPGGKDVEDSYHDRFRSSQVMGDGRKELFRLDENLRSFLGIREPGGNGRRRLPPSFRPAREIGSYWELDEELRDLGDDAGKPWNPDAAADLTDRLAYLDLTVKDPGGAGFAAKLAYFWDATHQEYALDVQERRERSAARRTGLWWISGASRRSQAADREIQADIQERADRSAMIRDLLVDALRGYGLDGLPGSSR